MRIRNPFLLISLLFLFTDLTANSTYPEPKATPLIETVVGLYSFNYLREVRNVYPITIAGHISEKLGCFHNITVLNESTFPVLGQALSDSKEAQSALAETVEQGRRKNANKLVTGFVSAVEEVYDYRTRTLQVSIILDIGIVDVESGQMEASKQFIFQGINATGIAVRIGLKKLGIPHDLITVDDVLAITGEKGLIKAIDKSLGKLDDELFPFLADYFGEYDGKCVTEEKKGAGMKLPEFSFGGKKNKDEIFKIVNKNSDKAVLISTNGNEKWGKRTSFDILTEVEEEDLMGNVITREVLLGTAKFNAYSGNYAIIELNKKSEVDANDLVAAIKGGDYLYVMYHQRNRAQN